MSFVRIDPESEIIVSELMVTSVYRPEPDDTPPGYGDSPGYRAGDLQTRVILPDVGGFIKADGAVLTPFLADANTPSSALIELLTPPPDLRDEVDRFLDAPNKQAEKRLEKMAAKYGADELVGYRDAAEDEDVTLVDPTTGLKPGLHIDNRDNFPLGVRLEQGRRRAGINVGPSYRWLLVVFPDLLEMAYSLKKYDADYQPEDPNKIFHEFMDTHPDSQALKCLRIPIPPGMAYRMPADSIAHEGSTFYLENEAEPTGTSRLVMFLGHWARGSWERATQ